MPQHEKYLKNLNENYFKKPKLIARKSLVKTGILSLKILEII